MKKTSIFSAMMLIMISIAFSLSAQTFPPSITNQSCTANMSDTLFVTAKIGDGGEVGTYAWMNVYDDMGNVVATNIDSQVVPGPVGTYMNFKYYDPSTTANTAYGVQVCSENSVGLTCYTPYCNTTTGFAVAQPKIVSYNGWDSLGTNVRVKFSIDAGAHATVYGYWGFTPDSTTFTPLTPFAIYGGIVDTSYLINVGFVDTTVYWMISVVSAVQNAGFDDGPVATAQTSHGGKATAIVSNVVATKLDISADLAMTPGVGGFVGNGYAVLEKGGTPIDTSVILTGLLPANSNILFPNLIPGQNDYVIKVWAHNDGEQPALQQTVPIPTIALDPTIMVPDSVGGITFNQGTVYIRVKADSTSSLFSTSITYQVYQGTQVVGSGTLIGSLLGEQYLTLPLTGLQGGPTQYQVVFTSQNVNATTYASILFSTLPYPQAPIIALPLNKQYGDRNSISLTVEVVTNNNNDPVTVRVRVVEQGASVATYDGIVFINVLTGAYDVTIPNCVPDTKYDVTVYGYVDPNNPSVATTTIRTQPGGNASVSISSLFENPYGDFVQTTIFTNGGGYPGNLTVDYREEYGSWVNAFTTVPTPVGSWDTLVTMGPFPYWDGLYTVRATLNVPDNGGDFFDQETFLLIPSGITQPLTEVLDVTTTGSSLFITAFRPAHLKLSNMLGQVVYEDDVHDQQMISLPKLASGLYVYELNAGSKMATVSDKIFLCR